MCVIFANFCALGPEASISATQRYVRNWVGMWDFIMIPNFSGSLREASAAPCAGRDWLQAPLTKT